MAVKTTAGNLLHRFSFDLISEVPDGHGGFKRRIVSFEARAALRYLRGGETVQASRLQGKQPVVVTVRRSAQSAQIDSETIMRDMRTGAIYNVRTVVPTVDRQFIEITAESGVAI